MVFTIVQLKNKNEAIEFKVSEKYIGHSHLWNLNEGTLLIHAYNKSPDLLREIGITSVLEQGKLFKFTSEQLRKIFSHYVQKGSVKYLEYETDSDDDDEELNYFQKQLGYRNEKTDEELNRILDYYDYLEFERLSTPINFNLVVNDSMVCFSTNSVISNMGDKLATEDFLKIYEEIFVLLNLPFLTQPISLIEKEKVLHPMAQSQKLMQELLKVAGETAKENITMSDQDYEHITEEFLCYSSTFANKEIYK